jgi:hypothetical protein
MKIIEPGHIYKVENVDGHGTQIIKFVRRRDDNADVLPPDQRREGIQSQELLRVLIDRTIYLHNENPWHENVQVIQMLRECLRLYDSRAARASLKKLNMPEKHKPCNECGHILCMCERVFHE